MTRTHLAGHAIGAVGVMLLLVSMWFIALGLGAGQTIRALLMVVPGLVGVWMLRLSKEATTSPSSVEPHSDRAQLPNGQL